MIPAEESGGGDFSFPAKERLTERNQFVRVLRNGGKIASGNVILYYLKVEDDSKKLGLIVGRSAGKAVARNRVKRIFREVYRHNKHRLPKGYWMILGYTGAGGEGKLTGASRKEALRRLRVEAEGLLAGLAEETGNRREEGEREAKIDGNPRWSGWTYGLFTSPIRFWQIAVAKLFPPSCRFYPSCSDYALKALAKYGPVRGTSKAVWRVLRCNPFSAGGYDPP